MKTFWCSYAHEDGTCNICVIDAETPDEAHRKAWKLGIPKKGSEGLVFLIPPSEEEHRLPRDRVLTDEELAGVGAEKLGDVMDREKN